MKKLLLGLAAAGTALAMVPLFAAFEAHVINVTARIENALNVPLQELTFGTVFPQEMLDREFDVRLSDSFLEQANQTGNLILNGGFETPDVPTGGWAIYPDASLTSWTVESGAGLEIQDHAAGNPHGGNQLAELDSNNSSAISQTLATVAGQQYRLTLWYSPRPGNPAGDNTIGTLVKVVSDDTILVNDTIGVAATGDSNTTWTKYTYNFFATDTATKVIFSDLGINNSYGGYLDDISVKELECTSQFEGVGACTLWGERDLSRGDTFFNFDDIKPGDHGTNVISLHVYSNNAYACLITSDQVDDENI